MMKSSSSVNTRLCIILMHLIVANSYFNCVSASKVVSGEASMEYLSDFSFTNDDDNLNAFDAPTNETTPEFAAPTTVKTASSRSPDALPVKKKIIKNAVTKSLTHKALSQKFVEVIPILRVLSSQQKIALASLISAQISAKPGTELKLSQVRSIFGNEQKLILPLVLDIANMVRNAAKNTLNVQYDRVDETTQTTDASTIDAISLTTLQSNHQRRIYDKTNEIRTQSLDNVDIDGADDDDDNFYGEIMDPIIINNALYDTYHQAKKNAESKIV